MTNVPRVVVPYDPFALADTSSLVHVADLPYFNIKDYGAKGVGGDDSAAINLAIAAVPATGGVVWIPDGSFGILASQIVLKSNLTIAGNGYSSQLLDLGVTRTAAQVASDLNWGPILGRSDDAGAHLRNVTLKNFRITGTGSNAFASDGSSTYPVNITINGYYDDIVIDGVWTEKSKNQGFYFSRNAPGGVGVGVGTKVRIRHCTVTNNAFEGINFNNDVTDVHILDSFVYDNRNHNIEFAGDDLTIDTVTVAGAMGMAAPCGIALDTTTDAKIVNCSIRGNLGHGIILGEGNACDGITVGLNRISDNGDAGISLSANQIGVSIANNLITANGTAGASYGIVSSGGACGDLSIVGNVITAGSTGNQAQGINLSGVDSPGGIVAGNTVTGHAVKDINIAATTGICVGPNYTSAGLTYQPEITVSAGTTPSVKYAELIQLNYAGLTTVTDFTNGVDGQVIRVFNNVADVAGVGQVTIHHDANKIFLNGSVDFVMKRLSMLVLVYRATAGGWFEIGRSTP